MCDFSSPLPVLSIGYLGHTRCQYIFHSNGIWSGGMEARMQWLKGIWKKEVGTGRVAKQFGSIQEIKGRGRRRTGMILAWDHDLGMGSPCWLGITGRIFFF